VVTEGFSRRPARTLASRLMHVDGPSSGVPAFTLAMSARAPICAEAERQASLTRDVPASALAHSGRT
jgi:hypothetical protein